MNFETMIRAALRDGTNVEDLFSNFTNALNKVQSETREKSEKDKREKMLSEMRQIFNDNYRQNQIDLNDVAVLAVMVCAPSYPDWTAKNLLEFRDSVKVNIAALAEMVTKDPTEVVKSAIKDIFSDFKLDEKKFEKMSDADRIKKFLNSI